MAWSTGTYTRTDGTRSGTTVWTQARDAGVKILAADQDTHDQDLATAINLCLTKDGQNSPTGNLPMGNYKHTGVANGSARTEYLALGQMQDAAVVYGTTTGSSSAYVLALSPAITAYASGQTFRFKANHTSDGAVTINVNAVGAKQIRNVQGVQLVANEILADGVYEIVYDATLGYFVLVGREENNHAHLTFHSFSVANATSTKLTNSAVTVVSDIHTTWDTSNNRLSPPDNFTALKMFYSVAVPVGGSTSYGYVEVRKNGSSYGGSSAPPTTWVTTSDVSVVGNTTTPSAVFYDACVTSDYYEFYMAHNRGSSTSLTGEIYVEFIR